jgi:hypothetical protein
MTGLWPGGDRTWNSQTRGSGPCHCEVKLRHCRCGQRELAGEIIAREEEKIKSNEVGEVENRIGDAATRHSNSASRGLYDYILPINTFEFFFKKIISGCLPRWAWWLVGAAPLCLMRRATFVLMSHVR